MQTMYQLQELVYKLPDSVLMKEASRPSGQLPIPMIMQELTRRKELRTASGYVDKPPMGMDAGGPTKNPWTAFTDQQLLELYFSPGVTNKEAVAEEIDRREREAKQLQMDLEAEKGEETFKKRAAEAQTEMKRQQAKKKWPTVRRAGPRGYFDMNLAYPPDESAIAMRGIPQMKQGAGDPATQMGIAAVPGASRVSDRPPSAGGRAPVLAQQPAKPNHKSNKQSISFGGPGAITTASGYPEFNDPFAPVIEELGRKRNYANPIDAVIAAEKDRQQADKPRWGEMGLAAAAALLGTPGSAGRGIGAALQSVLPFTQQRHAEGREDQRYLDQLGLQQAQFGLQDQMRQDDQALQLANIKAQQNNAQQTFGLGKLQYDLEAAKLAMQQGLYGSEINKNNAYAAYLGEGGAKGGGITQAQLARLYQTELDNINKDINWMDKSEQEKRAEVKRRIQFFMGTGLGAVDPDADALDAGSLFQE